MKKFINNTPKGFHVNSLFWKNYKKTLPQNLPEELFEISIGLLLGDASIYITKNSGAKIKIEQGFKHKEYLEHLYILFKDWTFYEKPYSYIPKKGKLLRKVKSFSFKTFSHQAFNPLWDLFIQNSKKVYKKGTIKKHLTYKGFSYWIADDGSLHKTKSIILNTQGFSKDENMNICEEINEKFNLNTKVIKHKEKYWVIYIPVKDVKSLKENLCMPKSIAHKLPSIFFKFLKLMT